MSLWNRRKPLTQPPGFGRVGHHNHLSAKPSETAKAADRAIHAAQFERDLAAQRVGGRRAVVSE